DGKPVPILEGRPFATMEPRLVIDADDAWTFAEPANMLMGNDPTTVLSDRQNAVQRFTIGSAAKARKIIARGKPRIIRMSPSAVSETRRSAKPPALLQARPKTRSRILDS